MFKFLHKDDNKPKERPPRLDLEIVLSFRKEGDFAWVNGKTKNINRSGALFRAVAAYSENTPVEFRFILPAQLGAEVGQLITCGGKIVRVVGPTPPETWYSLAARFSGFHVARSQW
jgi:hypothetical protein